MIWLWVGIGLLTIAAVALWAIGEELEKRL